MCVTWGRGNISLPSLWASHKFPPSLFPHPRGHKDGVTTTSLRCRSTQFSCLGPPRPWGEGKGSREKRKEREERGPFREMTHGFFAMLPPPPNTRPATDTLTHTWASKEMGSLSKIRRWVDGGGRAENLPRDSLARLASFSRRDAKLSSSVSAGSRGD